VVNVIVQVTVIGGDGNLYQKTLGLLVLLDHH